MHKFIANLGDVNFIEYGGFLVLEDKDGDAFVEVVQEPYEGEARWTIYRFDLDKVVRTEDEDGCFRPPIWCWFKNGVVPACDSCGESPQEFWRLIGSESATDRALAYQILVGYFGPEEFDPYPLKLSKREVTERYGAILGTCNTRANEKHV